MTHQEVFEKMFEAAKTSHDPKGIVAACLVDGEGNIVSCQASSDDGVEHAEYRVLREAEEKGVEITGDFTLYTTLEPDSERNPASPEGTKLGDSVSRILSAGVKNVIYGAGNPKFATDIQEWFYNMGAHIEQVDDPEFIRKSLEIFNNSCEDPKHHIKG